MFPFSKAAFSFHVSISTFRKYLSKKRKNYSNSDMIRDTDKAQRNFRIRKNRTNKKDRNTYKDIKSDKNT
jgi:hypothetical protein